MPLTSTITAINSQSLCKDNTGLGNVLFQVSSTIGIAKKLGVGYSFPEVTELCDKIEKFGFNHRTTIFRNINVEKDDEDYVIVREGPDNSQSYDENLYRKILSLEETNIKLSGYLQSHKYFNDYRDEIINIFSPDRQSLSYIKNKYPELFDPSVTCISVHVRQMYGGNIKYTPSFFNKALDYISNRVNNLNIFVFSDDIEWCKNNIAFDSDGVIFVENNPDYIDLWVMSMCRHNILSHSTLSWWGAYLNKNHNKIVIYPQDALKIRRGKKHSEPVHLIRMSEHYFQEWICLPCDTLI